MLYMRLDVLVLNSFYLVCGDWLRVFLLVMSIRGSGEILDQFEAICSSCNDDL